MTFEEWWNSVSIEGPQADTLDEFTVAQQAMIVGWCRSAWEACAADAEKPAEGA